MSIAATLAPLSAEIWLAVAGMALLMVGVFRGKRSTRLVASLTIAALKSMVSPTIVTELADNQFQYD